MDICRGRLLPEDCYQLVITIVDQNAVVGLFANQNDPNQSPSEVKNSNLYRTALYLLPIMIIGGFIGVFFKKKNAADPDPFLVLIGSSKFDKRTQAIMFEDNKVELSHKEAELLSVLCSSENHPVKREVILQKVWGDEGDYVGRTLDVFISKLRKKLELDKSLRIVNVRGVGYKLVVPQ